MGWLVNTLASAVLGLVVGAVVAVVVGLTLHRRGDRTAGGTAAH